MAFSIRHSRLGWSASWPMTLLTAAGVVVFVLLGRWQWHRAAERGALVASFNAGVTVAQPLGNRPVASFRRFSRVRVRGRYDPAHQFLLENMGHGQQTGYEVLTPMKLSDGRTLMINRGWVPMGATYQQVPKVAFAPAGPLWVTGRLDKLPPAGLALGHIPPPAGAHWPKVTGFPTMADMSAALGRRLAPRQLLLDKGQPFGYVRDWHPPGLSRLGHLSYALQWWSFAALALGLYVFLNRHRSRP